MTPTPTTTHDTINWKPMALLAALSLFGILAALSLGDTSPFRVGIAYGISIGGGIGVGTLAALHALKNYRQAKAATA